MKRIFKNIYERYMAVYDKVRKDQLAAFSAQSAFFLVLSFFPFSMALMTMVQYIPINIDFNKFTAIMQLLPVSVQNTVNVIFDELYNKSTGAVLSISIIAAIWSASLGIMSIMRGLNQIYIRNEDRAYLKIRGVAALYTLILVAMIIIGAVLIVFGDSIVDIILSRYPEVEWITDIIKSFRLLAVGIISTLVFVLMYVFIPNKRNNFWGSLPGSILSTAGFLGFSVLFGIYVDNFANYAYIYGSLAGIAISMLWLYALMYIFFMGAELNYALATPAERIKIKLFFRAFRKREYS